MKPLYILPYKAGSKSVKALRDGLQAKIIRLEGSNFKGKGNVILNWGNTNHTEETLQAVVINDPSVVKMATNKHEFFKAVEGQVPIPKFTTDPNIAHSWIMECKKVVVREKLTGSGGEGIVLLDGVEAWEAYNKGRAKLFVMYIPKKDEYRIHVMGDKVIDVQRKAASSEMPASLINWQIRNHQNGFIFKREGVEPPPQVLNVSLDAVKVVGLDFGAVDVVWNNHRQQASVLEVNTAPGLEGSTVESYIKGLTELFETKKVSKVMLAQKFYGDKVEFDGIGADDMVDLPKPVYADFVGEPPHWADKVFALDEEEPLNNNF
jgi:glutathione synthase/RimK-type ligase-like ATP-grasp enzyme